MSGTQERFPGNAMQAVSNTMVKLHKEQFGRGPTNARSYFAGPDTLVCTLEDSLLPAERTMVEMGEDQHVRESRMFLQVATSDRFIAAVEELVSRKVQGVCQRHRPRPGRRLRGLQLRTRRPTRRLIRAGRSLNPEVSNSRCLVRRK